MKKSLKNRLLRVEQVLAARRLYLMYDAYAREKVCSDLTSHIEDGEHWNQTRTLTFEEWARREHPTVDIGRISKRERMSLEEAMPISPIIELLDYIEKNGRSFLDRSGEQQPQILDEDGK